MTALRRFLHLPADEKRAVLFCLAAIPCFTIFARTRAPAMVRESMATHELPPMRLHLAAAQRLAHLCEGAAAALWWRPSCLVRSLVLRSLLRQRGAEAVLKIGVRVLDARMDAHCWIEYGGKVLNDSEPAVRGYQTLPHPGPAE